MFRGRREDGDNLREVGTILVEWRHELDRVRSGFGFVGELLGFLVDDERIPDAAIKMNHVELVCSQPAFQMGEQVGRILQLSGGRETIALPLRYS